MRTFLRTACCSVVLSGLATVTALGCASSNGESVGHTESTGEAISMVDHLSNVRYMPMNRPGVAIHKPRPNIFGNSDQSGGQTVTAGSGNLTYRGGPLIQRIKAHAVFWGSGVNSSVQSGIGGYYSMLEAIADASHESHEMFVEWIGDKFDAEAFDPMQATKEMRKGLMDWDEME